MSVLVVDTNIVSYLTRGGMLADTYRKRLHASTLTVSFMTVAELYEGAYRANWGALKLAKLEAVLRSYVVIPSSPDVCRRWGRIREQRRTQPISVDDAWIAATALSYSAALVTHNPGDFQGIEGLTVETELR